MHNWPGAALPPFPFWPVACGLYIISLAIYSPFRGGTGILDILELRPYLSSKLFRIYQESRGICHYWSVPQNCKKEGRSYGWEEVKEVQRLSLLPKRDYVFCLFFLFFLKAGKQGSDYLVRLLKRNKVGVSKLLTCLPYRFDDPKLSTKGL